MLKIDLHVHTSASFDSRSEPGQLRRRCRRLGLHPIFITDHDTIRGALEIRRQFPDVEVIVGEEIMTAEGEIIGFFLTEHVPAGLDPLEAVKRIKGQGGVVYLQHPFDPRRRHLTAAGIERIADQIDLVEVYNRRSAAVVNKEAVDLAKTLGVPRGAGSDAHHIRDLGTVRIEIEAFSGPADFLEKMWQSRIVTSHGWAGLPKLHRTLKTE